jgi:hypothetical protein
MFEGAVEGTRVLIGLYVDDAINMFFGKSCSMRELISNFMAEFEFKEVGMLTADVTLKFLGMKLIFRRKPPLGLC